MTLTYQMRILFAEIPEVFPPQQKLAHTLFSAIQWAIALNWRCPSVPWSQVLLRMESIRLMERVHHTLMDSMHIFDHKSENWSAYQTNYVWGIPCPHF